MYQTGYSPQIAKSFVINKYLLNLLYRFQRKILSFFHCRKISLNLILSLLFPIHTTKKMSAFSQISHSDTMYASKNIPELIKKILLTLCLNRILIITPGI